MPLRQGKIPPSLLKEILSMIKIHDKSVIIGPKEGFDSAVIEKGNEAFVLSVDPSLFIPENIPDEFFAFGTVNWPASDVSVFGAKPRWMLYNLLLPVGIAEEKVKKIASLIYKEAKKLDIDIIGGHTGVYKTVSSPISSATVIGVTDKNKLIFPSGAREGDYILLTKFLGLEFVVSVAFQKEEIVEEIVGRKVIKRFKDNFRNLTVVREALALANEQIPNAMHDVTEGGFLIALKEIADNANLGFELYMEELVPPPPINDVLEKFGIDPLRVSSSGCLIVSIQEEKLEMAKSVLKKENVPFKIVGRFVKEGYKIIDENGKVKEVSFQYVDDFAKFFS